MVKDNCNPVFDETFEYVINQAELYNKQLEVTVGSQKQLFSSNSLGQVSCCFKEFLFKLATLEFSGDYRSESAQFDSTLQCLAGFTSAGVNK